MDKLDKDNQLTDREKKLYLLGAVIFGGLLMSTIFIGRLIDPLSLLQVRLLMLGIGLIYYIALYFYYTKTLSRKVIQQEISEEKKYEIIVWFNGRELRRL